MEHIEVNVLQVWKKFRQCFTMCDEFAMSMAIDPDIITEHFTRYVTVETQGLLTRGQVVIDWNGKLKKEPQVTIVTSLKMERHKELVKQALA